MRRLFLRTLSATALAACTAESPEQDDGLAQIEQAVEAIVTPLPSAPSGAMPPPLPAMTTTSIGSVKGTFSVNSTGGASYSIPIEVPPGRRGLAPGLSLRYDSQAKSGWLGTGWSLAGAWSMIVPCGRDMTLPEGDVSAHRWSPGPDRLCLDGEQLVQVNPATYGPFYGRDLAEYRTARDSFRKIVQHGTPAQSFTVFTKDGRILTYGAAAACASCNGRLAARDGKVRAWALTEVADRFGNVMHVTWTSYASSYVEDYDQNTFEDYTGAPEAMELYPSSIAYGGGVGQSHTRKVTLGYSLRPDVERGWESGIRSERTRRLSSIQTWVGTRRIRTYNLGYVTSASTGDSLLASVEECAGVGDSVCKPKTTFEYSSGGQGFAAAQPTQIMAPPMGLPAGGALPATALPILTMDINDDRKTDLVYPKGPQDAAADTTAYTWRILKMGSAGMANAVEIDTGTRASWPFAATPLDYNQDGKMDLLLLGSSAFWHVLITSSTGTALTDVTLPITKSQGFVALDDEAVDNYQRYTRVADLDGDGTPDLLTCEAVGSEFRWKYRFHDGTGWGGATTIPLGIAGTQNCRDEAVSAQTFDTDGDGAAELVLAAEDRATYQAIRFPYLTVRDTKLPSSVPGTWSQNKLRLVDINHDGLMDIMTGMSVPGSPGLATTMRYWLNLGDRFAGGLHGYPAYADDYGQYAASLMTSSLIDEDGDGSHDLLVSGERTGMSGCGGAGQNPCPPERTGNLEILRNDRIDVWPPQAKLSKLDTGLSPLCTSYPRGHTRPRALDENGDLLPDLVFIDTTAAGDSPTNPCWSHPGQFVYARHQSGNPDLLIKVRDGMTGIDSTSSQWASTYSVRIDYGPTSSSSVYQESLPGESRTGCTYPLSCARPPMLLVRDTWEDRGEGNAYARTSYDFFDARTNKTGHGFLGFGQRKVRDWVTGAITTSRYDNFTSTQLDSQSAAKIRRYPFIGALLQSTRDVINAAGAHVVTVRNLRHKQVNGPVLFPYTSYGVFSTHVDRDEETVTEGATLLTRVVKTFVRDTFGNETCVTTDWANAGVTCADTPAASPAHNWQREVTTFSNDPNTWLVGLARDKSITGAAGLTTHVQRTVHDYSATTGALVRSTLEPASSAQLTKTTFSHDVFGNVIETSVSTGTETRTTKVEYDAEGIFPYRTTNAVGHDTRTSVDRGLGVPLTTVDANGLVSQFQHDGLGRLRRATRADNVATTVDYLRNSLADARFSMSVRTSTDGGETKAEDLDRLGRVVRETTTGFGGASVVMQTTWDPKGKIATRSLPGFGAPNSGVIRHTWDNLNRLIRTTHADGTFTRIEYRGLQVDMFDQLGARTTRFYKERGQTAKVQAPSVGELSYTYAPFGALATVTDRLGNVTRIQRDNYQRPISIADPNTGTRTFAYDAFGQLVAETDANGATMQYSYDKLGRLVLRTDDVGHAKFVWDVSPRGIGKVAATSRGNNGSIHRESYAYDTAGRLASIAAVIADADEGSPVELGHAFSFDTAGNLASESWSTPESQFELVYAYDSFGHLQAIKSDSKVLWTALAKNAAGQLTEESFLSGYRTSRRYHPTRGWPTGIDTKPIQSLEIEHDARGNVTRRVDAVAGIAQRFEYNADQELVNVWLCDSTMSPCPGGERLQHAYSYDAIGNMTSDRELGARVFDGSRPQLVIEAGGETYEYDKNGYTTARPGQQLAYTTFGKLKRVDVGDKVTELRYSARDERALKIGPSSRTAYLDALQRTRSGSGVTARLHIKAGGRVIGAITRVDSNKPSYTFFHTDHLGSANASTTVAADGMVRVEQQYAFDPFGTSHTPTWSSSVAGALQEPMESAGFTGHDHDDDLGLIDMGGRVYDPRLARFLTPDPIVQAPFKGQDLNRYSYAWNNPLRVTDPTGYNEDAGDDYGDYDDYDDEGMSMEEDFAELDGQSLEDIPLLGETVIYGESPNDQSAPLPDPLPEDPDNFGPDHDRGRRSECEVERCYRAADLPGGQAMAKLGLYHQWIRTPNMETGMGKQGGGVPGADIQPTLNTALNDHKGEGDRPGSICEPVCGISAEEIEGRIREGTDSGLWIPLVNDCNNVVEDALVDSGADPAAVDMPWHADVVHSFYEVHANGYDDFMSLFE